MISDVCADAVRRGAVFLLTFCWSLPLVSVSLNAPAQGQVAGPIDYSLFSNAVDATQPAANWPRSNAPLDGGVAADLASARTLGSQACNCINAGACFCRLEATPPHRNTGFIDFNTYWDTRDSAVTTFNVGAKLAHDFEYFQLLNLDSPYGSGTYDWASYYTEINLRRRVAKDHAYLSYLDWTAQYADGNGPRGVLRLGVKCRFHDAPGPIGYVIKDVLKLKYAINFHLIETDGSGWQMEHTYRRSFLNNRIYIAAFADHNINDGGRSFSWVTEHQVGVRVIDQWHVVAEYRLKTFAPPGFKSGWGLGLEYVIRFD
ncbi:MAG: hypothetical protein QGG36_16950 [Pirellulaceae bacterium]|nr:hypothetical protein [Pirellulaceae bacterium]